MPRLINQTNEELILSLFFKTLRKQSIKEVSTHQSTQSKYASEGNLLQMLFTEIYQSHSLKKSDQFEEKATLETLKVL